MINVSMQLSGKVILPNGIEVHAADFQEPVSGEADIKWYWIDGIEPSGKVTLPDGTELEAADQ
jgi:hypothetical protein